VNAESILADIDHGIRRDDVTVFGFRKGRALILAMSFALTGFGVLGIAVALAPSVNPNAGAAIRYGAAAFVGLVVLAALWQAWKKADELWHADTNLIVVSSGGVIRRLCGRVQSWPFAQYPDITFLVRGRQSSKYPPQSMRIALDSLQPDESAQGIPDEHAYAKYYGASSPTQITVIYLNEKDASFQHELVDDGTFGSMGDILQAIVTLASGRSR
jgi:hypothetical protein